MVCTGRLRRSLRRPYRRDQGPSSASAYSVTIPDILPVVLVQGADFYDREQAKREARRQTDQAIDDNGY